MQKCVISIENLQKSPKRWGKIAKTQTPLPPATPPPPSPPPTLKTPDYATGVQIFLHVLFTTDNKGNRTSKTFSF